MSVDVLFIHPGNHKKTYQELSNKYTAIAPPTWTSLLANYVRKNDFSVAIHDVNVDGFDATREINKYSPNLVVIMVYGHHPSASTQTMDSASSIARDIKNYNKNIPIAMGGTHPSALPERTLRDEAIDYVIVGEGAYQVVDILHYLNSDKEIKNISGIWYIKDETILLNKPSPIIKHLDITLDNYAFDLLPDFSNYRAHDFHTYGYTTRSPYVTLNTSLGCPYSCDFCCINSIFGKPGIRYWSLDIVFDWIDELVNKYHVQHIRFDDELFIFDISRVEKICDFIINRRYDLNIFAYARVDTINEKLLSKMKRAGFNWLGLGIESASKTSLRGVNKVINKNIVSIVKMIKDNGINISGNFMFGLPDDNIETMTDTFELAVELNCESPNFFCTMAYPGSKLYNNYSDKQELLPESWNGYSQYSYDTKPLPTKYLESWQVLKFRDNAFKTYCSNKKYLDLMSYKFGEKVKNDIKDMLKVSIKRRLFSD